MYVDASVLKKLCKERSSDLSVAFEASTWKEGDAWMARIILPEGKADFVSVRTEVRHWRKLDSAIREIKELCPCLKEFTVILKDH